MTVWQTKAACRLLDPELFDPPASATADEKRDYEAVALAVCGICPVRAECLELVLAQKFDPGGVWGGTTEGDRDALRALQLDSSAA